MAAAVAPSYVRDLAAHGHAADPGVQDLKAKVVVNTVHVEEDAPKPVADDFMYDFKYSHPLPTPERLGVAVPEGCDAQSAAESLIKQLADATKTPDPSAFGNLFLECGVWRDKLAFTWDYRTFNFRPAIVAAAKDLLEQTKATNFALLDPAPKISQSFPDFTQLQFVVSFDTEAVGVSAVISAVYTKDGWKIYFMHSVIESLRLKEPTISTLRNLSGLALAARCRDIWKKRYEYLSLHFPHWADDLPYFTYPKHWPTYTPAQKQGIYMSWYASALELNVWCKSSVIKAEQDPQHNWTVVVDKEGKETRTLRPKHVVMATSLCGVPLTPVIPGTDKFKGTIRHSTAHDSSRDFVGKRVCVVGTSSSGLDTAYECVRFSIDVTLLQRSPTYVMSLTHCVPRAIGSYAPDAKGNRGDQETLDRMFFATPTGPGEQLAARNAKELEDLDREMLDALNAKGFRTWRGQLGTGNHTLSQTRNGGFYFDAGACEQIINGKIKVEQGYIERFTKDGVVFNGGREQKFDLVIFATGFSNTIDSVRSTLGEDIASRVGPIWGIDEEGEYKTAYKESGVPNLWIMCGFLAATRYQSKLLALRLKALDEGVGHPPYRGKIQIVCIGFLVDRLLLVGSA
ncbi:hypothetical protein KVT40_008235 [Elsinoe batatas]|uniref:Uncharacterized protein n=1 Tax=Elsinoe batatas TaxID=2601811 RepID=A0A8K0KUZ7_9PEZI|nr:hypothetical protein KVT40_008235 [Elsinoe batatas]